MGLFSIVHLGHFHTSPPPEFPAVVPGGGGTGRNFGFAHSGTELEGAPINSSLAIAGLGRCWACSTNARSSALNVCLSRTWESLPGAFRVALGGLDLPGG